MSKIRVKIKVPFKKVAKLVDIGQKVYWSNSNYEVVKNYNNQYNVKSKSNRHYVGLKACGKKKFYIYIERIN